MLSQRHIQAILSLTAVAFALSQWRRVREWYMELPMVQQFACGLLVVVLVLGVIARQCGVRVMVGLVLAGCAALVLWVGWLAFKTIRKL